MKLLIKNTLLCIAVVLLLINRAHSQDKSCENKHKHIIYTDLFKVRTTTVKTSSNIVWNDSLIESVKDFINSNLSESVIIHVHTDSRGTNEGNMKISQIIAETISKKFKAIYPKMKFIPVGLGEECPLVEYKLLENEKDRDLQEKLHNINSRVEFIIP